MPIGGKARAALDAYGRAADARLLAAPQARAPRRRPGAALFVTRRGLRLGPRAVRRLLDAPRTGDGDAAGVAARAPPQLRDAPAGRGGRSARDPGDARPRQPAHDAALRARRHRPPDGGLRQGPPPSEGVMSREKIRSTTVLAVRRDGHVVIGGDGQVTMGNTVVKATARKIRRLARRQDRGRLRGQRRRRHHAVREVRGAAQGVRRQPRARRGRAGQGLAHRSRAAPPGGAAAGRRSREDAAAVGHGRRHRAGRRRGRDRVRAGPTRSPRRARCWARPSCRRARSPSARWRSPARSASTRTACCVFEELGA